MFSSGFNLFVGFFYKLLISEIKWRDEILLCLVSGMCVGTGAEQQGLGGGSFAGRVCGQWAQQFVQPQNVTPAVLCHSSVPGRCWGVVPRAGVVPSREGCARTAELLVGAC